MKIIGYDIVMAPSREVLVAFVSERMKRRTSEDATGGLLPGRAMRTTAWQPTGAPFVADEHWHQGMIQVEEVVR